MSGEPRSIPDEPEEEARHASYELARQLFNRLFVQQLLREIAPKARLVEFLDTPPNHYTLGIKVRGEIGKALMILSKRLVDHASTNPAALRSLRLMLRSEVLQQRSRYATDEARAIRATEPPPKWCCAVCERPIGFGDRVVVHRAEVMHKRCDPDLAAGAA